MKINPINNPNIIKAYSKSQAAPVGRKPSASGLDQVTFSSEALSFAKTLAEVKEAMPSAPTPQRQAMLADIADRIRTGQYSIDSGDVADKMISDILGRYKD